MRSPSVLHIPYAVVAVPVIFPNVQYEYREQQEQYAQSAHPCKCPYTSEEHTADTPHITGDDTQLLKHATPLFDIDATLPTFTFLYIHPRFAVPSIVK